MKDRTQIILTALLAGTLLCEAGDLFIRPKNFIVTPSTGPVTEIIVHNRAEQPYKGTVSPVFPEGWRVAPESQTVELQGGETNILSFAIQSAADLTSNAYEVSVKADGAETLRTTVVCASTPYFKPEIDGSLDEWGDAIPISFLTGGKKTTVRTYWNRDFFCLAAEVEEDRLTGLADGSAEQGIDAIQFALAPGRTVTATGPDAESVRYEFLAAASGSIWKGDKCFQLLGPGEATATAEQARPLEPLRMNDAEIKVRRSGNVTAYELMIPMKPMRSLRATAGREYCFSLLVHDPDGTGMRDLGSVMNLQDEARNRSAWCNWEYAVWDETVPFDNKIEFGFCSSVH
ncbi:MAG TPA: hypothetical protein VJ904_03640 [Tichowtungia sp.]|nr:hypothetical protein [Tichowtungia sp.]